MCMAGLSLEGQKPLILMLSTLIGKCVLVSAFDLLQICRIAPETGFLDSNRGRQLAQNCYFPLAVYGPW